MAKPAEHLEYRIKPGDSLSIIMNRFYGMGPGSPAYAGLLQQILSLNPHIKNPDMIHAGTILRLMAKPAPPAPVVPINRTPNQPSWLPCRPTDPAPNTPGRFVLQDVPTEDEIDFWTLSWIAENSNHLLVPGSIATGAFSNLLSPGNIALIEANSNLYAQYKAGDLTRGQYDYRRRENLNLLRNNIGPMERLLFGNQTPHQAIRIARGGGVPATHNITNHANRLKRLASYGKYGGYVLGGIGVAASCMQIADTDSRQEKNEIFVETVTSTTVGLVAGSVVTLFLVSNPVGWGTALVLAAGSAAVSYAAGQGFRKAYTFSGTEVDLVSGLGVDSVCQ